MVEGGGGGVVGEAWGFAESCHSQDVSTAVKTGYSRLAQPLRGPVQRGGKQTGAAASFIQQNGGGRRRKRKKGKKKLSQLMPSSICDYTLSDH